MNIAYLSRCFFERRHHLKHRRASPCSQIVNFTSCISQYEPTTYHENACFRGWHVHNGDARCSSKKTKGPISFEFTNSMETGATNIFTYPIEPAVCLASLNERQVILTYLQYSDAILCLQSSPGGLGMLRAHGEYIP